MSGSYFVVALILVLLLNLIVLVVEVIKSCIRKEVTQLLKLTLVSFIMFICGILISTVMTTNMVH